MHSTSAYCMTISIFLINLWRDRNEETLSTGNICLLTVVVTCSLRICAVMEGCLKAGAGAIVSILH